MKTPEAANRTKKSKVFIVDDHCILREGLSHLINSEEDLMVCGETDNVSDALQAIEESQPDIVIVDISLGDGSGIRLTENLMYAIPGYWSWSFRCMENPSMPSAVLSQEQEAI